ncbi:hypothetical protein [Bradyrhizobium icense]|uniref:hypothetical protein n=1 Tax=Bradyrhizobium icense TaxID=1274631 RepID=UPI0018D2DBFC|nr:hypothetical protein [Bradyrhizobium icense]
MPIRPFQVFLSAMARADPTAVKAVCLLCSTIRVDAHGKLSGRDLGVGQAHDRRRELNDREPADLSNTSRQIAGALDDYWTGAAHPMPFAADCADLAGAAKLTETTQNGRTLDAAREALRMLPETFCASITGFGFTTNPTSFRAGATDIPGYTTQTAAGIRREQGVV